MLWKSIGALIKIFDRGSDRVRNGTVKVFWVEMCLVSDRVSLCY